MNTARNEELITKNYNRAKLVLERDKGIIIPDEPDKVTKEWAEMVSNEIVAAIRATFPLVA